MARLRLKVLVPEEDPEVPTVTNVYINADWYEREAWDMMGILPDIPTCAACSCPPIGKRIRIAKIIRSATKKCSSHLTGARLTRRNRTAKE